MATVTEFSRARKAVVATSAERTDTSPTSEVEKLSSVWLGREIQRGPHNPAEVESDPVNVVHHPVVALDCERSLTREADSICTNNCDWHP